ncbi:MAG: SWIM zinc finger family protein [Lactobacillus sp.]|jgi:Tfp pilus assembly protein PilP|nr:SWIM zinc finger family protein [Lactobacillus sp.]
MAEWESIFPPIILEQGRQYFKDNAVTLTKEVPEQIQAQVKVGKRTYQVKLDFAEDGSGMTGSSCTCSRGKKGIPCEHLAAVIFKAQSQQDQDQDQLPDDTALFKEVDPEALALLDRATDQDILVFLEMIMTAEPTIKKMFEDFLKLNVSAGGDDYTPASDFADFKDEVQDIVQSAQNKRGVIESEQVEDFIGGLRDLLMADSDFLLEIGEDRQLISELNYIYEILTQVKFDEPSREADELVGYIESSWRTIFKRGLPQAKDDVFQWLQTQMMKPEHQFSQNIERFWAANFKAKDYLAQKLNFAAQKLALTEKEAAKQKSEHPDQHEHNYQVRYWATEYIRLMITLKKSEKTIAEFVKQHKQYGDVQGEYVKYLMDKKHYKKAAAVLKEAKRSRQDSKIMMSYYSFLLQDLYLEMNDQAAYANELWLTLTDYDPGNIKQYQQYKVLVDPKQWPEKQQAIFLAAQKHPERLAALYELEHLTAPLAKLVIETPGLELFVKYNQQLPAKYAPQLLTKYETELNEAAQQAHNRTEYRRLAQSLQGIKQLKGGAVRLKAILKQWRTEFTKRPAMLDELKNVKA